MQKKMTVLLAGFSLFMAFNSASAVDANARSIAVTCWGCHGYNGASSNAIPPLKGRSAENIKSQMMLFKSGDRPGTIMNRIAKGYSDTEIDALAKYISELK